MKQLAECTAAGRLVSDRGCRRKPRGFTSVVSLALLLVFSASFALPLCSLLLVHEVHEPHAWLASNHHAPCSGEHGSPNDRDCVCLCCPGHARISLPACLELTKELTVRSHGLVPRDELHPTLVFRRIFHPPRA